MNLKQLVYLRKAIELGNITLAARELNVAQTALGIQIRNLEEELGVTLLSRHSRGVTATPAGAALDRYGNEILDLVTEARKAMRAYSAGPAVSVTLGVTPSLMRMVGDDILVDLARLIPDVTLRMVEEFSFVLMRLLEQGELDCALTFAEDVLPDWASWPLLDEDLFYLTAPAATPPDPTITFREVLTGTLALTGRQDALFAVVERMARRLGMALNVGFEVQSLRAVKNLVAKGIAATIMPYGAAEGELRSGALRARLIVEPNVTRRLVFVYPKARRDIVETQEFRTFIGAIADRLHAAPGPVTRRI